MIYFKFKAAHTGQNRHLMKKAPYGQFLLGPFALSFAALLTAGQSLPTRTAAELQPLQGTWEGVTVGDQSHQKITIAITGNSFHFHRDTNFWFATTITLPAGTDPKQLHATITDSSPPTSGIGEVIFAIFKIEDGTLTLAAVDMSDKPSPEAFDSGPNRYILQKVQPQTKNTNTGLPKTK